MLCAKVPWWVEGKSRNRRATVCIASIAWVFTANGKERPSRGVAGVGDAVCGGFEEVEPVERGLVDAASQDGQELEEKASSNEDQRSNGEQGSCFASQRIGDGGKERDCVLAGPAMVEEEDIQL